MSDIITVTGIVATIPRALTTSEGLAITSFRLASSQRKFDKSQERWVDGETNWYTITTFRQLATNCAVSVHKGERIVVTGRLRIRDWQAGDKTGTNVEVDADAVGHDLGWGTASYSRNAGSSPIESVAAGFPHETEGLSDARPDAVSDAASDDGASNSSDPSNSSNSSVLVGVAAGSSAGVETPF